MSETKLVVLDDDPTGSQTVHGCLLLTRWDADTLREALLDAAPLFFVLTNTRGMNAGRAAKLTREVCRNLKIALDDLARSGRFIKPIIISRSDSTLRGHYPVETDVIADELGPFDAHFLIPAFIEGGRVTRDGVHYLLVDGIPVPVNETEFARDSVFGYRTAFLPEYVEEKTRGRIRAGSGRTLRPRRRSRRLSRSTAEIARQCRLCGRRRIACRSVRVCRRPQRGGWQGKRFLCRSAAGIVSALAALPPQPVAAEDMRQYVRGGTARRRARRVACRQDHAASCSNCWTSPMSRRSRLMSSRLPDQAHRNAQSVLEGIEAAHARQLTAVIFTSRTELAFPDEKIRLAFGETVSTFLMDVVRRLPADIGFLISKGGITSNDVLSHGLALRTARVLGQILPGCSVVRCPADHPQYPALPVVIFPGNVGDDNALALVLRRLAGPAPLLERKRM